MEMLIDSCDSLWQVQLVKSTKDEGEVGRLSGKEATSAWGIEIATGKS